MYDLKHELISVQIKLENAEKALDKMKEENRELQMKIVKLETEMKIIRKNRLSKDSLFYDMIRIDIGGKTWREQLQKQETAE